MEKILILTHGGWGMALKSSIEMIIDKVDFVDEIALLPQDLVTEYKEKILAYIEKQEQMASIQQELLHITVFTDLFGGTTTNVAAIIANTLKNIDVVTGLNSPLLLEACMQIQNQKKLDVQVLLTNSKDSIFNVMERIYRKEGLK